VALVYSYIRYSTKKQMAGDSFRRQVEDGDRWIAENAHTPANRTLHDLGVSAFKGRHRHRGALSRFLQDIEEGRVSIGSILLVENLDRLSREGIDEACELFRKIIRAGVDIATLMPTPRVYTRASLNDPIGIIEPILCFHNAYLESQKKSERIAKRWQEKRKRIADGEIVDGLRPSWLDFDKKTKTFKLNEGAKAVRCIFQRAAEGDGQRQIVRELQRDFPPIGRSRRWNSSFVQKVLCDRAVLGERRNCTFTEDGERVPVGSPVPGYYPAVIDESLWFRAQAKRRDNIKKKGPTGDFINLFTGLIFNVNDGSPMHVQRTNTSTGTCHRRLVSYAHLRSIPGSDPVSVDYELVERLVLYALWEVNPDDLVSKESISLSNETEQELRGVTEMLAVTQADLSDPANMSIRHMLVESARRLEERRQSLQDRLDNLRADRHSDTSLREAKSVELMLKDATGEELRALRLRLRSAISDIVEQILIKPEKYSGKVYVMGQIRFRSTPKTKQFWGGRGHCRAAGVNREPLVLDKDHRYLEHLAELDGKPVEMPVVETIPDSLRHAANLWLKVRRAEMSKASFSVVPSKIERFLDVIGDLSTIQLDASRWDLWVRTLRMEVREGSLKRSTARVTYSRAREFVRWLIDHGKTERFPELEASGEQALHTIHT